MRTTALLLLGYCLPFALCFPTAENWAKLARSQDGGSLASLEELQWNLLELKEKRLLFDPLTTPIDGECWSNTTPKAWYMQLTYAK
jgi:hypothetical protein